VIGREKQTIMNNLWKNGTRLAYLDSGGGPKSMLLVHGWGCDHTALAPQIEYFRASYRVVAVDLRGHGASDAPHQEYTVQGFADDLAYLCGELRLRRPVVIGHSMGGTVSLELAARSDLISAVVLIDSVILPQAAFVEALRPFADALCGHEYREALRETVSSLFLPTDDAARKSTLLSAMCDVPQHVLESSFRNHVVDYDATPAASKCRLPLSYIAAARRLSDLDHFQALCPQLMVGQTLGAGHFSPLEVPDQVNSMIERFCAIAAGRSQRTTGAGKNGAEKLEQGVDYKK
jgi:pimeloyl-ACP methyl ester carboxylesterase